MAKEEEDRLCSADASGAAVGLPAGWPSTSLSGIEDAPFLLQKCTLLHFHKCHNTVSSTGTQALHLLQDDYARKPSEGKTAKLGQLPVRRCITLHRNRQSRQLAPASLVSRLILLTVHELALASQACQSGKKQLWVVWHF